MDDSECLSGIIGECDLARSSAVNGTSSNGPVCGLSCRPSDDRFSSSCTHVVILAREIRTGSLKRSCDAVVDLRLDGVGVEFRTEGKWPGQ